MAFHGKSVCVVVPAHDEERLIGKVIGTMPSFVDRVIVVDDGSGDGTARRVLDAGLPSVSLVRHPRRRGVGAAIRSGYRKAIETGPDAVAVMPGDAQADPRDLPALLAPVASGACDYSKGNRLADPSLYRSMPRLRLFGNRLLSRLTRWALLLPDIDDSQCGYTVIARAALEELIDMPFCDGYGYPNEMLCALAILEKRIVDVPVRAVYGDERSGIRIPSYAAKTAFVLSRCFVRRMMHRRNKDAAHGTRKFASDV